MGYPKSREVVVSVTLNAEECEIIEAARQSLGEYKGRRRTFGEVVAIWVQVGVEDRIARERRRLAIWW